MRTNKKALQAVTEICSNRKLRVLTSEMISRLKTLKLFLKKLLKIFTI
jgi:hypothetical protein